MRECSWQTLSKKDRNPAFLVPFVTFLGLLIFIFVVQPAFHPAEKSNVFQQWEKKLPAGLTGLHEGDLAVCAQWEAEQRRLLHRWQTASCDRGFELGRPRLDDNKYYTDVILLGPRIIPLLAKRIEWEKQLANPEFIGSDVIRLWDCIAGSQKAPAKDARDLYSYN